MADVKTVWCEIKDNGTTLLFAVTLLNNINKNK